MEIDPQFQKARERSKNRQSKRRLQFGLTIAGALAVVLFLGLGIMWLFSGPGEDDSLDQPIAQDDSATTPEAEGQFVQVEETSAAPPIRVATPFVDIPGDPMILRFENAGGAKSTPLSGPLTLDATRIGNPGPERLLLIHDDLIVQQQQLITALPSSREDFAFFQAQRSQSLATPTIPVLAPDTPPDPELDTSGADDEQEIVVLEEGDNSLGDSLQSSGGEEPTTYVATRIENTTSIAYVRPEAQREKVYEDIVVRMETTRSLSDVLLTKGFSEASATDFAQKAAELIPSVTAMPAGSILALRVRPSASGPTPLQMSVYGPEGYIGSLARQGTFGYIPSSDPWIDDNLLALAVPRNDLAVTATQNFRLLDAVYSAAIRNGVPTTLVGEMIVMLSQAYDLEAFAAPGDQVTLLYAPVPASAGPGPAQILFAGIKGPSGDMPCYVAASAGTNSYTCFSARGQTGGPGQGAGFTTPVAGTMTSPFGPRFHPILKEVRLHGGVDWAAPTGTPIVAAMNGKVNYVGDGGGYGNVIYIDHADGLQSRYAHMSKFADGIRAGQEISAGTVIGYVGTTGRSTGPHLHFEFRRGGEPVDPFSITTGGGGARNSGVAASDAVEALTDQIIHVESGGNANAQNPLSSATGLGQFIESTWLRMMRDYRPDLSGTMSRTDLLALRTDPTLSREMVQNLARENENFLRSKGHEITVGRLYLAHFLGPGGANTVLSSSDSSTILAVMGQGVVSANPFLRDFTVADLKAWADRKMSGAGAAPTTASAPVAAIPPEIRAFMTVIDEVIADAQGGDEPAAPEAPAAPGGAETDDTADL